MKVSVSEDEPNEPTKKGPLVLFESPFTSVPLSIYNTTYTGFHGRWNSTQVRFLKLNTERKNEGLKEQRQSKKKHDNIIEVGSEGIEKTEPEG